mmetsp:Transcript_32908/g.92157  ORF Transcript_32908/g.92157 Transcript_32908/m.92157 type:complete len:277 (+) Transcript_32908:3-833(+)
MGRKNKGAAKAGPECITLPDGTQVPVALPPGMTPQQMQDAVAFLRQHPGFAKKTMEQVMRTDPAQVRQLLQMQRMHQSPAHQAKLAMLKEDPELKEMWDDIAQNGQQAMRKYWDDPEWMARISAKMGRLEFKRPEPAELTTLHAAAKAGDAARCRELLEAGEDVNGADARGISPLGVAVGFNRLEVVALLVERGAAVDQRDAQGNAPLHYAAGYGRVECLRSLLEAGAEKGAVNQQGQTPLDVARLNKEQLAINALEGGDAGMAAAAAADPKSLYL